MSFARRPFRLQKGGLQGTCRLFVPALTGMLEYGLSVKEIRSVVQVRMARYKRKRILKSSGGIAPQEGHTDYKIYRYCCKLCEKYY